MHAVAARARTQHLCSKAGAPGTLVGAQPPPPPAHLQRAVSAPRTDLVRHARYRVDAGLRRGGRAAGPWLAKSTEVRTRNALLRVPWLCVSVLRAFVLGVCLCSIRLDRAHFARQRRRHRGDSAEFARQRCPHRGGSPARALCWRCACLCALAHPMLALRVPAVRALAAHACVVRDCASHARVACTCCACPRCACPRCALSCWACGVLVDGSCLPTCICICACNAVLRAPSMHPNVHVCACALPWICKCLSIKNGWSTQTGSYPEPLLTPGFPSGIPTARFSIQAGPWILAT